MPAEEKKNDENIIAKSFSKLNLGCTPSVGPKYQPNCQFPSAHQTCEQSSSMWPSVLRNTQRQRVFRSRRLQVSPTNTHSSASLQEFNPAQHLIVKGFKGQFVPTSRTHCADKGGMFHYRSVPFECMASVEVLPCISSANWTIGFVQACDYKDVQNIYGSDGVSRWDLHPTFMGHHTMVSDSSEMQKPFYDTQNGIIDLPIGVHDLGLGKNIRMEDCFSPTIHWVSPNGVLLTKIHRRQGFYIWLVAIRWDTDRCRQISCSLDPYRNSVFVMKTLRWQYSLTVLIEPFLQQDPTPPQNAASTDAIYQQHLYRQNGLVTVHVFDEQMEPEITQPLPLPHSALMSPFCNSVQSLVWYPSPVPVSSPAIGPISMTMSSPFVGGTDNSPNECRESNKSALMFNSPQKFGYKTPRAMNVSKSAPTTSQTILEYHQPNFTTPRKEKNAFHTIDRLAITSTAKRIFHIRLPSGKSYHDAYNLYSKAGRNHNFDSATFISWAYRSTRPKLLVPPKETIVPWKNWIQEMMGVECVLHFEKHHRLNDYQANIRQKLYYKRSDGSELLIGEVIASSEVIKQQQSQPQVCCIKETEI